MDGQLQASHLILGCKPVYSIWQSFSHALLVDSAFLSYIDVRHANFLPSFLTVGEAWDLGPRYTIAEDLEPVRDQSAKRISQSRKVHIPVEEPKAQARIAEPEVAEADQDAEMVSRQKMTVDQFLPDTRPMAQP